MKKLVQSSLIAALFAVSAQASAQSVTYAFDYLAQANTSSTLSPGASLASLGLNSVGSITFTDLSDLHLNDGETGVRISITLGNLSQFYSGSGSIYSNSVEFSLPGTGDPNSAGDEWIGSANSLRQVSNNFQFTTGGDGGIEWDEQGSVGNGTAGTASSHKWAYFQQQNNFVTATFTPGETITFDYLNGDTLTGGPNAGQAFDGFSVANLLAVSNQDGIQPDAFAWLRIRSADGGIGTGTFSPYLQTNATSGLQTLQFLAVTQVPEADTYAMFVAGLGLIGGIVRRRKSA